jgi:two-component system, OmpR family, response regulator
MAVLIIDPHAQQPETEPQRPAQPEAALIRVFVAEDSRSMQSALKDLLETLGNFQLVGSATTETQATDWLYKNRTGWDVAVLDLILEEGSGFGLLRRCKDGHPSGTVVVFSEFATPVLEAKCIEMGASAVFLKSQLPDFVRYLEAMVPKA